MAPDLLAAYANVATAAIALVTALIIVWQIREMRRSTSATAFKAAYDILQTDRHREEREFVMSVLKEKPFTDWNDDDKKRAERVCQSYDVIAIMCKHGFLPTAAIAEEWGDSLRKTWSVLAPLVSAYRVERNSKEFWDDFEWLAGEAQKYQKHVYGGHA